MARIPMGNFGGAVARAPGAARIGIGQDLQDATQRMGATVQGIALDQMQAQTRLDAQERQRQEDAAEAAARGQEALALQNAADQLTDLHDEVAGGIRDGTVPKDQAEKTWTDRADKMVRDAGTRFRPESRDLVSAKLQGVAARLGNGVRKAKEQRDRQDVTASLDGILESTAREYARDPATATAKAQGALATLGPQSTYAPDVLGRKGQQWLESAQGNSVISMIQAAKRDPAGIARVQALLSDAENFPQLTPEARLRLTNEADNAAFSLQQREDARRERVLREQEARLRRAESSFSMAEQMAATGVLSEAYRESVRRDVQGTPREAAFVELLKRQASTGPLAAMPLPQLRAMVDQARAYVTANQSPEAAKRLEQLERVEKAGTNAAKQEGGLAAFAARSPGFVLAKLDWSGGVATMMQSLPARLAQANMASTWSGQKESPFTQDEASALHSTLSTQPPETRAGSVAALASVLPVENRMAFARQVDAKGEQGRALAAAMESGARDTTNGRYTGELIFKGQRALADKTIKEERTPVDGWRGRISTIVGGVFQNPEEASFYADKARFILAGLVSEGASGTESDVSKAVSLAVHASIREVNGARVPLPPGTNPADVTRILGAQTAQSLGISGGFVYGSGRVAVPVADFLARLPSAQLQYVEPGKFAVKSGRGFMAREDGEPIVIEIGNGR